MAHQYDMNLKLLLGWFLWRKRRIKFEKWTHI